MIVVRTTETRDENFTTLAQRRCTSKATNILEKCIHCLIIRDTSQIYALQPWWRWFSGCTRRLDSRVSTTVSSHSSCSLISRGIKVTPYGRLPSVQYSPRGSSIEDKCRDPNVCFMTKLKVACREKRPALLIQERPCKLFLQLLPQWHVCATQLLAPRRKPIEMRSADLQVSGLGSCKGGRSAIESQICLDERLQIFERRVSFIPKIESWAV